MTDKEKIRAEVYRRFVEAGRHDGVIAETREDELSSILSFIDSLQEEPVSEDLEDAAYNFVMDNFGNPKEPLYKFDQRCFKAGAQWQKEHSFSDPQINENIIYAKGYKQAEKDLTLTWEDISIIRKIMYDYNKQIRNEMAIPKEEEYCKEVLKRFLEQKGGNV